MATTNTNTNTKKASTKTKKVAAPVSETETETETTPVLVPVKEPELIKIETPELGSGSESDKDKSAKKLNAYQQFVNETVNKLKVMPDHAGKKYMELRALANIEWRVLHPPSSTDEGKPKRVYKKKEKVKTVDSDSEATGDDDATTKKKVKKDKEPREKREPTAYNIFVKSVFADINEEFKDKPEKPSQREKMKIAAERWREVKAAN